MSAATREQAEQEGPRANDEWHTRVPAAVALQGVTNCYGRRRRGVQALSRITADFPRGSFSGVMRLSGSGKSTLLQVAAGVDRPSTGSVHLGGVDLSTLKRRQLSVLRRRRVGFVFRAFNLVPSLSVAENIALPLRLAANRPHCE